MDFFKFVFGFILPPKHGEDPYAWRWSIFLTMTILIGAFILHVSTVYGYLEPLGLEGMATSGEVHELRNQNKQILYAVYAPQIRAKIRERCDTVGRAERERINLQLDWIMREYRDVTGETFSPMPRCDEV